MVSESSFWGVVFRRSLMPMRLAEHFQSLPSSKRFHYSYLHMDTAKSMSRHWKRGRPPSISALYYSCSFAFCALRESNQESDYDNHNQLEQKEEKIQQMFNLKKKFQIAVLHIERKPTPQWTNGIGACRWERSCGKRQQPAGVSAKVITMSHHRSMKLK